MSTGHPGRQDADQAAGHGLLTIGGADIPPGARTDLLLPVSESYTGDRTHLPVTVCNGIGPGPVLFVTAAIHGDELNGIGIVHELLGRIEPNELAGAMIAVPVVNVLGVQFHSRYLPDRRDLNRSFPGSPTGSTASRIAHTLMTEVVAIADAGVDLHTAANRRLNVPQIRCSLSDARARHLAEVFGAPFLIDAKRRGGSLRDAAGAAGVPVLTFEGGEALRFEPEVIEAGTEGVLRVMVELGMVAMDPPEPAHQVIVSDETHWVRADRGGILDLHVGPEDVVEPGQPLWTVTGPFGRERSQTDAPHGGVVIGMTTLPLVNPGDAVVHLALPGQHEDARGEDEPTDDEDVDTLDEPDEDDDRDGRRWWWSR